MRFLINYKSFNIIYVCFKYWFHYSNKSIYYLKFYSIYVYAIINFVEHIIYNDILEEDIKKQWKKIIKKTYKKMKMFLNIVKNLMILQMPDSGQGLLFIVLEKSCENFYKFLF